MKDIIRIFRIFILIKRYVWRILFSERERIRAINSLNISGIDQPVRKALFLQEFVSKMPAKGCIVECGVAYGWSLGLLSLMSSKKIFAFDSFEGFPKGSSKDSPSFDPDAKWLYKLMNERVVERNLIRMGIKPGDIGTRVILKKGFFPKSFDGFNERVALVHLDVDLYQSYKDSLEYFFPLLERGGGFLFDEYDTESDKVKWPGAKIAIDEFAAKHGLTVSHHWTRYAFIRKT